MPFKVEIKGKSEEDIRKLAEGLLLLGGPGGFNLRSLGLTKIAGKKGISNVVSKVSGDDKDKNDSKFSDLKREILNLFKTSVENKGN